MKSLIIGYGSIGQRHTAILQKLGHQIFLVTKRDIEGIKCYQAAKTALDSLSIDYVVISNKTAEHFDTLVEVISSGFSGPILVEKPLFESRRPLPELNYQNVFIAYNLRFHPILQSLRRILRDSVFTVNVYTGQYLPDWRPARDYRQTYSASTAAGGGVLQDLSHELDYLSWLWGPWKRLAAIGGKLGRLEIESDDVFCLLLELEKCPAVNIQINYLDRVSRREIIINTQDLSIKADLVNNFIEYGSDRETFKYDRNFTYRSQHTALLSGDLETICSFEEGLEIVNLIDQARQASNQHSWMYR